MFVLLEKVCIFLGYLGLVFGGKCCILVVLELFFLVSEVDDLLVIMVSCKLVLILYLVFIVLVEVLCLLFEFVE